MSDVLPCRSVAEAHLFLDLAGAAREGREHRLEAHGDDLVAVYDVAVNGSRVRFRFRAPDNPLVRGFGGARPSEIIDAGQFLMHADRLAKSVPAEPAADAREPSARRLDRAADALDEIVKFIPDGAREVPDDAFWTPMSETLRTAEPGRFHRERLQAAAATYRALAAQLRAA